jgi:hypothetical protein
LKINMYPKSLLINKLRNFIENKYVFRKFIN